MLMQGKHVESYHNMVCPVRMTHSCCVCEGGKMEKEALFSVVFPLPWRCGGRALFVFWDFVPRRVAYQVELTKSIAKHLIETGFLFLVR